MKRALLTASLLAAASTSASAGTYVGLGIGTAPAVSEDTNQLDSSGRSGKVMLGNSFGKLAIEGAITKYSMARLSRDVPVPFGDTYQAAVALKLTFPLGNNFEAFGRGGLHHTWLKTPDPVGDTDGNGMLIGAGFGYHLNLGVGGGSLFVDYQISTAKLTGDKFMIDMTTRVWMLGLTVGL